MLIEDLVMEASVSYGEASELSGVPVRVLAARDCSLDQTMLQELLIEVASVSAEVTDQVANLRTDASIFMTDQSVQIDVDVSVMDRFVELFGDSGQLTDQTESVDDQRWWILSRKQAILGHGSKTTAIDELFGKVTRFLSCKDKL